MFSLFHHNVRRHHHPRRVVRHAISLAGALASVTAGWYLYIYAPPRRLNTHKFVPTTLKSSETVSADSKLLRLKLAPETVPIDKSNPLRPIWSLYIKNSDIQVERAYTPLQGISPDGEMVYWIKAYEHGEMGRWLHERQPGDMVEVRGPEQTWGGNLSDYDHIVMIAGGTGITPFYQLLYSVFEEQRSTDGDHKLPRFTLLHSHKDVRSLPPDLILGSLTKWSTEHADVLRLITHIDNLEGDQTPSFCRRGRLTREDVSLALRSSAKDLDLSRTVVLVCGPDPMMTAIAGQRGRDLSQGPVGGVLASVGCKQQHVWKL